VSIKPKNLKTFEPHQVVDWVGPRMVGICVAVRQFGDINIMNNTFTAEIKIYVDWTPTSDELKRIIERGDNVIDPKLLDFDPAKMIIYKNAVSFTYSNEWTERKLCYIEKYQKFFIRNLCAVQGVWREVFELESFPVDVQDLTFKIQLGWRISQCVFVPTRSRRTCIQVQTKYAALQDYEMGPVFGYFTMSDTSDNTSFSGEAGSQLHMNIKLIRNWGSYVYRIQIVLTMISFSTMACFTFEPTEERIAYCATMLLTAIAFQFICLQILPDIPYLTLLDLHIYLNFFYIWIVGLFVSLSKTFHDWGNLDTDLVEFEIYLSYAMLVLFVAIQVSVLIISMRRRNLEKEKLRNYIVESDKGAMTVVKVTPDDKKYLRFRRDVDAMGQDVSFESSRISLMINGIKMDEKFELEPEGAGTGIPRDEVEPELVNTERNIVKKASPNNVD